MDLLEVAKERFDLQAYVQARGGTPAQRDNWELDCPMCGRRKLVVSTKTRTWHCWHCERYTPRDSFGRRQVLQGAGGIVELLELLDRVERSEAVNQLLMGAFWATRDLAQIQRADLVDAFSGVSAPANPHGVGFPPGAQRLLDGNMPYLIRRGISFDDVQAFGLFFCVWGRYRGRLMFPVWESGRLVYYQGRATWDPEPWESNHRKALNPTRAECGTVSTEVVMNLDAARHYPRVGLVEGPIDCVHAGLSAVCGFGKQITFTQIAKLVRAGVRALDLIWDASAWAEALGVAPFLATFFELRPVKLPDGTDPGELPRQEIDACRAVAQPYRSRLISIV